MTHLFIRLIVFFKKEHWTKYVAQFILFAIVFCVFLCFAAGNVIENVVGTVVGFLFSTMILYLGKVAFSYFEDILKVSCDTEQILKTYKGAPEVRKTLCMNGTEVVFAYADSLVNQDYEFVVEDHPERKFELDEFIMNNYELIFSAHSNSVKFNATTIRLDHFELQDNLCKLYLSRSTVFNHLVTNRAMDFILFDDVTLRSVYEYGPKVTAYKDSKMSNHIGVNGLVFLSDGYLLVPQRNGASTISKHQITSSIAVKLDGPSDGSDLVTARHLTYQTIIDNLSNRVKIPPAELDPEQIEIRFLGFGQNLYEGGKPQFYYVVHLKNIDSNRYFHLNAFNSDKPMLDIDRCIHVADYRTYRFKKDRISFDVLKPDGSKKNISVHYELSYLSNLWHYEKDVEWRDNLGF